MILIMQDRKVTSDAPPKPYAPEIMLNPIGKSALAESLRHYTPKSHLGLLVRDAVRYLPPELAAELIEHVKRTLVVESQIKGHLQRGREGKWEYLGVLSRKVITTVGVGFMVDAWQNLVEMEIMKYHGFGSGSTAEASGNTALVTEFTTEYATDNTRPTGSLTEGASGNIFRTVGTFSPDASVTVAEHGIFSQASNAGGVLWDRSLTGSVALTGSADSLQITYDATLAAGG